MSHGNLERKSENLDERMTYGSNNIVAIIVTILITILIVKIAIKQEQQEQQEQQEHQEATKSRSTLKC